MIPLLLILLIVGGEARAQSAPNNKSFSVPAENMPQIGNYNFTSNAIASPSIPSLVSGVRALEPPPTNGPVNEDFKRGACWAIRAIYEADNKSAVTITSAPTGIIQCDPPAAASP